MATGKPKVGLTFSHYRLLRKLGEGGMGVVYTAVDTHLGREVAVKFLLAGRGRRLSRARFLREARSTSVLSHPNIATVYDYGETDEGWPFIVMELLHGETLSDRLATGPLAIEQTLAIIGEVLDALGEAHRHCIVHRDIKPANIVIGEREQVKVVDFGLAKSVTTRSPKGSKPGSSSPGGDFLGVLPTQTLTGAVLGTPLYASPEQSTGKLVDERSDFFSVGAVLYECLAGRPAFAAPSVVEIYAKVINPALLPPPSSFNPAVPAELDRIAQKALAKAPEDRYQSAEDFLAELRRVRIPASAAGEAEPELRPPARGSSLEAFCRRIVDRGSHLRATLQRGRLATSETAPRRWDRTTVLLGIAAVAILAGVLYFYRQANQIDSVAILPFVNESGDESIEPVSAGFTESLISRLSQIPGLKVISPGSVAKYKGQEVNPAAVGAELNVNAILTGRIIRNGDELNLKIKLLDVHNNSLLWTAEYRKKLSDVANLQGVVAQALVANLGGQTSAGTRSSVAHRPYDPAAYELYTKGRWYWNKFTVDAGEQAIQCFQQAIDIDPNFALAYAGLADTYVLNTWVPPEEAYLRANAAAKRALELDDQIGEAHATLGFIKSHFERDWAGAELEFKRAIELSPGYATAHHWYADQLLAEGQFDKAFDEMKLARELDPLSPIINTEVGLNYFYRRQYDRAIEHFKMVGELFPDFFASHYYLGWAYTQKGMYPEAIAEYEKALTLSKGHSGVLAMLGYTEGIAGRHDDARNVIRKLEERAKQRRVTPYRFALVYTGIGDRDMAFQWLNRAYDERDIMMIHLNVSPFSDSLREDPRFDDLVRRMGLGTVRPESASPSP